MATGTRKVALEIWKNGVPRRPFPELVRELYAADWSIWFPKDGDPRHGTPDDPRMVLIGITVHAAEFLEVNKPRVVMLYELVKGWITGTEPKLGEAHELTEPHRS